MDNIKIKLITEDIDYGRMLCDGIAYMHRDIIMELETEEGTCNDKRDADLIVIDEPMLRKIVYDDSMMILCEKKSDRTIDTRLPAPRQGPRCARSPIEDRKSVV